MTIPARAAAGRTKAGGAALVWSRALEAAGFYGLLAGLAVAPVWLGSDRLVAWGANAAWYGGLVCLVEAGRLVSGVPHPVRLRRLWPPAAAIALVLFWIIAQISPGLPSAHPLWDLAGEALGRPLDATISLAPDQGRLALLRLVTALLVFWLALQGARDAARAHRLVAAVAVIGGLYAVYGLLAFILWPQALLWTPKRHYLDSLTSTFVNRNSYATYAGMGLVCALTLALGRLRLQGGAWPRRIAGLATQAIGIGGAWLGVAFVLGMALVLTGSRGGVGASLAGVVLLVALVLLRGRKGGGSLAFAAPAAILVIGVTIFAFGDFLGERLSAQGLRSDDRLVAYALTWLSIADAPLTGFGYGGFAQVFPMYRDDSLGPFGVWDRAHDTYLEAMQGLGLPAAGLFCLALAWLVGRCLGAALRRERASTAPLAAAAASLIVGLHAFVDFSLQAQGVALTWAALLGAGVAQSWSSRIATHR